MLRLLNMELVVDSNPYWGKRTNASRIRLLTLMEKMTEAASIMASTVRKEPLRDRQGKCPPPVAKVLEQIQELLDEYPATPRVGIGENDGLHFDTWTVSSRPIGEQIAVSELLAIAESQRLDLIRRCTCGLWFSANRHDQKACSATCRHKTYEQTDDFKKKRRDYMRGYYKLKQSGKVK